MNETSSFYSLFTALCSNIVKEVDESEESYSLNEAKSVGFQVLLKNNHQEFADREKILEELQFSSFELSLAGKNDDSKKLNKFIEQFRDNSEGIESICSLLVHLKNIDPNPVEHQNEPKFFKIPSNFKLVNKKNVYFPSNSQKIINLHSDLSDPDESKSFFSSILEPYMSKGKRHNFQPLEWTSKPIEPSTPPEVTFKSLKLANTWENLEIDDSPEKSFSSEHLFPIQLKLSAALSKDPLELRTVAFDKILNDIKLLSIGIESETFQRAPNDPLTFQKPNHFNCERISDVSQCVDEFLEAGTCFKRLKTFTSKNPFNQSYIFEGFIFKAFCDCVINFLNYYRDIVYSQEVTTLLEFSSNTRGVRRILVHLTKFLKIHQSSTSRSVLPTGSDFLGLLYNEYTTIFNSDVKCFFVDCLKTCCQVYFNNFHKWLFQGFIDDQHNQLFIYFVDHYRPNTKYFFDKAYLVRKQSVPGFLQGCAENILLCGKYTMLLKSYNQVHPLFLIQKPLLRVCLTDEEMSEMKAQFKEFAKAARLACGESISIEKVLREREQTKREKCKIAESASVTNMLRWRREQEESRVLLAKKRELQMQGLRAELERIEESKLVKRMEAIQAERDYIDEANKKEDEEIQKETLQLLKRIDCYKELNQQLDDETERREKIVEKLKNTLESKEDVLNANESIDVVTRNVTIPVKKTDEMNNIITTCSTSTEAETEAKRNKLKIMSHEYNLTTEDCPTSQTLQTSKRYTPSHPFSEAQRNRLKVLGSEFNIVEPKETAPKINVDGCENMSDLQRNRLKVLSHEYNLETKVPQKPTPKALSLSLLQVESSQLTLESPMSVTSDHFSNESELQAEQEQEDKSKEDECIQKSPNESTNDDENVDFEMLKAFEDAIEKNSSSFIGINLNKLSSQHSSISSYEHIKSTDTMALSRFLQMSLMIPVNAYMNILNNETLKMFVQDLDILLHFKSLRNYFLMMSGEFGSSICHQLFSRLETGVKPSELLNYHSLHVILDHALSQSRNDINTDRLSFIVQNIPDKFELHSPAILNMLTMSYKLEWPLNLILNPETMEQYQAIFNYLLKLKRISWVLEDCFQMLKELNKKHGKDLSRSQQYRHAQQSRHKMTHFVHCLENHVTRNVLQISWNAFIDDLKSAQSILCIYRKHTSYLKRVLFLCLLNKKSFEFQKTIEDSFKVILKFHKHLKARDWVKSDGSFTHPKYEKIEADAEDFERLLKYILYLGNKIIQHGYQKEIYDLLYLIDINGYYSKD